MKLTINIDGGSRGNPGPAAYGCYIQYEDGPPLELKGKLGRTTNNVAEYHGLIRALEKAVELGADEVHIRADSELLVRQMTGVYRVKNENILPLYQAAQSLVSRLGKVHFRHVYREQNTHADRLCNEALDDPRLPSEELGLRHSVERPKPSKPISKAKGEKPAAPTEYARVKLIGSLLALTSLHERYYAVLVKGTSWRLNLKVLPKSIPSGAQVQVLGEMVMQKSTPLVKVKSIKKA